MITDDLAVIAKKIRRDILRMHYEAGDSHLGCSMSIVEIMIALYFIIMKINPAEPKAHWRDRFILSKGHAVSAVYAVMAERGFFPKENLWTFAKNGSRVASHVERDVLPGVETNGGSGGHGLSLGVGMALASFNDQTDSRVFVLMGDGELQEGSVWEALMFAGSRGLSNLVLIVDRNNFQICGKVEEVVGVEPLIEKFRAFGWDVEEVDGHDVVKLAELLKTAGSRPRAVVAKTVKGKGVSFMEGGAEWHTRLLTEQEYEAGIKELS